MIFGIGVDLLDINRVKILYNKYKDKLPKKILSQEELFEYKTIKNKENYLAKHFSAKESFSKALGTGMGRGFNLSDITIKKDILKKPIIELSNSSSLLLESLFKVNIDKIKIDISITDENNLVQTFCVISKI